MYKDFNKIFFLLRYSHPTVTSGARPEYISLAQQQTIMSRPYDHDMSKSYSPGTLYGQATSPGRRYRLYLFFYYQRQITLRIVGSHFSSRLTATINLCLIYLKLLLHVLSQYGQCSCDFEINQTKIKGGCQSGRKVVTHNSKSYLPLVDKLTKSASKRKE